MMKEWLNKKVLLIVRPSDNDLTYTCTITNFSETHFSFTDKFNKEYTYRIQDIIQIEGLTEE